MGDCKNHQTTSTQLSCTTTPPKLDWYQTDSCVFVNVLVKCIKDEDVAVDIDPNTVNYNIQLSECSRCSRTLHLSHIIIPSESGWKLYPTKLEIKLKKGEAVRWECLERPHGPPSQHPPPSCPGNKNWDQLLKDIEAEESREKLEGDAALNQLFQRIYANGSDEVRKAMNKSYMESGGTVLSTNWTEVKEKKVEVKPPSGMEFRSWEQ